MMNCIIKVSEFGTEVFTSIIGGALLTLMVDRKLEWFQNHLLSIVQVSEIDCIGLSSRIDMDHLF